MHPLQGWGICLYLLITIIYPLRGYDYFLVLYLIPYAFNLKFDCGLALRYEFFRIISNTDLFFFIFIFDCLICDLSTPPDTRFSK